MHSGGADATLGAVGGRGPEPAAFLFLQNQLSGYLLRKFKNSTGWQKLWVVFTDFCLFFYKTHQVRVLDGAGGGL